MMATEMPCCSVTARVLCSLALAVLFSFPLLADDAPSRKASDDGASAQAGKLLELVKAEVNSQETISPSVLADVDLTTDPPEVTKVARTLRETKVDLSIERQPLDTVLKLLQEASGVPLVLSAKAQEALRANPVELTLTVRELPIENAFNLIALQLEGYRFTVRCGAVVLIRSEEHSPRRILRIYDVSDIVRPRPDFPAPPLGLKNE